ncbi:TIGR02391 family protein [Streptomyces nigra]|uniref:TIGR02391 family protein n=1 Tax=Streptomyces nigra TaxID=1827580 RepID=UPI003818F3F6
MYEQLRRAEPTVKQILRRLDPSFAEKINFDQMAEDMARDQVPRGLGILADMDEWAARLEPDAPTLPADQFHPWVWEPAAPLWGAEARQEAVLAAARTVNRRLQQKLGRHDIGETDLCMQAFHLRLGTGTLIDPRGVTCTVTELAAATGLSDAAVENALYVAQAHGWIRETSDKEYRLTVPGEDIGMYEYWLQNLKEPVRDTAVYQRMRDQLVAATR